MSVRADRYPSRCQATPSILPRQDPVIYSQAAPPPGLSPEQAAAFERDGFLFCKSLFTAAEVTALRAEMDRLVTQPDIGATDEAIAEPDSGIVRSLFRVHHLSPVFERLARDPRLLQVVRYILGDDVYIHQSRINLKPGFTGKEFYWHADFETWHTEDGMPAMRAVSVSIALTDNNPFNGPLMVVPGSHKHFVACVGETPDDHYKASLRRQEIGTPDHDSLRWLVDQGGIVAPTGPAGSALFFDCNIMHGSAGNISPFPRSNIFFVYNSVQNTVVEPFGPARPRPEFVATRETIAPLAPAAGAGA